MKRKKYNLIIYKNLILNRIQDDNKNLFKIVCTAIKSQSKHTTEKRATLPQWLVRQVVKNWDATVAGGKSLVLDPSKLDTFYYHKSGLEEVFVYVKDRWKPPKSDRRAFILESAFDEDATFANFLDLLNFGNVVPSPYEGLAQPVLGLIRFLPEGRRWLSTSRSAFDPWVACTPQKQLLVRLLMRVGQEGTHNNTTTNPCSLLLNPIRRFMELGIPDNLNMVHAVVLSYGDSSPETTLLNVFLAYFANRPG